MENTNVLNFTSNSATLLWLKAESLDEFGIEPKITCKYRCCE